MPEIDSTGPECLNCGHTFPLHSDGYFCYARADGTLSPVATGETCLCGYWNPPVETEPEPEPEAPTEPDPTDADDTVPAPATPPDSTGPAGGATP